jgi:hypothetical protein
VKQPWLTTCVALVLLGAVTACSGNDEPDEPRSAATSSSVTTDPPPPAAASATATATPEVPAQPTGSDGVTYEIQNWERYASDPVVLSWKQVQEALGASTNRGEVTDALRDGSSKKALRKFIAAVDYSRKNDLHVPARGIARVEKTDVDGDTAKLTTCLWAPSISVYDNTDTIVGDKSEYWYKQQVTMASASGQWVVTSQVTEGKCPGNAP